MAKKAGKKEFDAILEDYSELIEYLKLSPEEQDRTPPPDIEWERLAGCLDGLLGVVKDPQKMYPDVDSFNEVEDMDTQKVLFAVEKKALHCDDQPVFIRIRSICNFLGMLIFLGREISGDDNRFAGIEKVMTMYELSFVAAGIYRALFELEIQDRILKTIEALPQGCLTDVVNIIGQVAESGHLVAQVGPSQESKKGQEVDERVWEKTVADVIAKADEPESTKPKKKRTKKA